ncbi:MAG TPA: hypothetical protein DCL77_05205 [Prolixibacteraceae bacterium]|jgi:hypothetical protein|nr:hypothetical protein [Prolixibacteraceae bacterium]
MKPTDKTNNEPAALKGLNISYIKSSTPSGLCFFYFASTVGYHPRLFKFDPFRVFNPLFGVGSIFCKQNLAVVCKVMHEGRYRSDRPSN